MARAMATPRGNLQANVGGVANANPTSTTSADGLSRQQYGRPWEMLRTWQATTTTQLAIDPVILQRLAEIAQENANSTAPARELSGEDYERLWGLLRAWQADYESVASHLNDVGFPLVTPDDIEDFVGFACIGNFDDALAELGPRSSWANHRAVPALDGLLMLVTSRCNTNSVDLDDLSNRLVDNLDFKKEEFLKELKRLNELKRLGQDPSVDRVPLPRSVEETLDSACGLFNDKFMDWLGGKLNVGEDGDLLLTLTVGALVQGLCSSALVGIIERISEPSLPTSSTLPTTS